MKVYQGNGAPTPTTYGNVGDYYLDLDTDKMYKCVDIINHGLDRQFLTLYDSHPDRTEYVWESKGGYGIKDFSYFFGYCTHTGARMQNRVEELAYIDTSEGTSFKYAFNECTSLTTVPELDTSKCTDFSYMFRKCINLTSISGLDVRNGILFEYMFTDCSKLVSLPAKLDTSKGTSFLRMFQSCSALTSVPELDTSNGTSFSGMFYYCKSLISVPELDTSNGTLFYETFSGCTALKSIPKLDVNKATTLNAIVNNCEALTHLRLYNIRKALTIGSGTSYGHLLDVDSLVHTIKELCKVSSSTTLTMGTTNKAKIANLYCKITDDTTEKLEMELCDSTDADAMTLEEYAAEKGWTIA